ncbi:MAG: hypothetical protein V1736_09180 [Pseudomonadota bacterium]
MQKIEKFPFLSCLNRGAGGLHLKVALVADDPAVLEKAAWPFLDITDSDPLARLLRAEFETDSGSILKKVFLLVQRDWQFLKPDELTPVTNPDIDRSWQRAFSCHLRRNQRDSFTILADQIDEAGRLKAFQPAFFCKSRQLFFCPPCPRCGTPLEQCYEDELLAVNRLQPYTSSLNRYLYCPDCAAAGNSDFYTYEQDKFDPPTVRDRWALIRDFATLVERGRRADGFACADCFRREECYGPESQSLFRIVPFSFYPFYMLIFEAMSLSAPDFLALVGGASYQDLRRELNSRRELGRVDFIRSMEKESKGEISRLLDPGSMQFGEVFYLKLSFLAEFMEGFISGGEWGPGVKPAMDRIWVKLSEHGRLLPFLWTFRVNAIGFGLDLDEDRFFSSIAKDNRSHFAGRLWFYTLLVNHRQNVASVYHGIGDLLEKANEAEWLKGAFPAPVFLPENLFWNPEEKSVSKNWGPLWNKALNLGWSLLVGNEEEGAVSSVEKVSHELNVLRSEIKMNLFVENPEEVTDQILAREDEAIQKVLTGILAKWQAKPVSEKIPQEPQEEELAETVILSLKDLERKKPVSPAPSSPSPDDEMRETVILSASGAVRHPRPDGGMVQTDSPPNQETKSSDEDTGYDIVSGDAVLAETVIIRPKSRNKDKT